MTGLTSAPILETTMANAGMPCIISILNDMCRRPLWPTDIVVVLDVVAQPVNRDGRKSGFREEALGRLAAPHRAETIAALRQRDGHAVHAGNRVEQRADR